MSLFQNPQASLGFPQPLAEKPQHRDSETGRIRSWDAERFFRSLKIVENGCWEWIGKLEKGYGRTSYRGKRITTHQLAWLFSGRRLWKGHKFEIAHSCHNRRCCNPDHLAKATSSQNKMMSSHDGRLPHGKTHKRHVAKLTKREVLQIKQQISESIPLFIIARRFGVTRPNISQIKRGFSWKDGQF